MLAVVIGTQFPSVGACHPPELEAASGTPRF